MNPLKNKCIWVLCITAIVALATTTNAQICYLKTLEPVGFPSKCFKLTPEFQARLSDETSSESTDGISSIVLPLPNGEEVVLSVTYAPIMEAELRQRYPEIRSYKVSADGYSGRIGYTYKGFHGMLFTPNGTVYYDPLNQSTDDYYCYYRKDYTNYYKGIKGHYCHTDAEPVEADMISNPESSRGGEARSGEQMRTYQLALACTGEYAQFHGGTVSGALSAYVLTMNRVNGVYEREFAITMVLINNTDDLIFLDANSDPYTNSSGSQMLGQNQSTVNSIIGSSNYDIGHVFSTGGGGIASLRSVCSFQNKAKGVTGSNAPTGDPFDIDYVAHEMGHQFGGNHTQNNSCNRASDHAFEPGSASTIMGYAGICAPNLQNNSDDYFHVHNYDEVISFAHNGNGNVCASISNTGNTPPEVTVPNGGFFIPIETPFRLEGSATDADGDDLKYCWEQMDLGPSGHPDSPSNNAPIFRSWEPSEEAFRVFPKMVNIIIGNTVLGETYPTYDRDLTFRLTARDYNIDGGGVDYDEIEFEVSEDAGPFVVTSPAQGEQIEALSGYEITWDVAGTDQMPVNCQNVTIELCKYESSTQKLIEIDTLAISTPNDGSEIITFTMDNIGNGYYVRVKASDNIFFNINGGTFSVIEPSALEEVDILLTLQPDYVNGIMAVDWNDDFTNETNWFIEKSINSNQSFFALDTLPANTATYFDSNVTMYGEEYHYRVFAENTVSISDYSNEVVYEGLGIKSALDQNLLIYPNPTNGELIIKANAMTLNKMTLFNLQGQILKERTLHSAGNSLDMSNLKSGIYLVQIETSMGIVNRRIELIK